MENKQNIETVDNALGLCTVQTASPNVKAPLQEKLISSMCIKNFKYEGGGEWNLQEACLTIRIFDQSHC